MNAIAPQSALGPLTRPGASRPVLSRRQKAAVVVQLLATEGLKLPLEELTDDQQTQLAETIAELRLIDRETMVEVIEEFCTELEAVGIAFPGGIDGALKLLEGQLSASAATRLRRMASGTSRADPWERITGLSTDLLLPVLQEESIEVGAVMLSKLTVARSAELLSKVASEKARKLAYAVSLTGNVAPETVHRIGTALASQLDAQPAKAFETGPVERVGAILNYSPAATRNSVLEGLDEEDKIFADQVRKAIFTFTNIPSRIETRDIPKILRAVDQAKLIVALAGAKGENEKSAEFILSNMSQRMAQNLRDEIANLKKPKEKDIEEAMNEIVGAIRELEANGEIFLVAEDGE
ncbi:flagellar motor switch protein FliG [Rhodobacter aestuarii]|uniref:Flagellar motor switch protein FliG n=1 Tax=Rhodobacter aestuarii TaxID=453582 RepID=A0A1N7M561_9RHOB|nr:MULTISPECIES: FliG C-terminal domain-containing protein [Rhodobacter]PTV94852.1 flagellar motor switch protein FliG [Rhodobacter aestuarii]SIS81207.1 flagellar motor switch protein FliG [Rhodobacter aestuarii]SOC14140.1 flagellar motor switch protein FliG [Rhodobacter sp. JA431]